MFESKAKIQRWSDCGDDFFYGQDGEKVDYEMAAAFYEKAMKKKHPHATFMMGLCYELGRFVDKDLEYAELLYEKASEYGDKDAKKRLKDGKLSVPPVHSDEAEKPGKNRKKKTGQARKPDLLGGDTGEIDVKAVRQALEQESQRGSTADIKSPQELAKKAYAEGDYKKAYELYKKLAEKGDAEAQFMTGKLCFGGTKSFCNDIAQAKMWFEKAAAQGHKKAEEDLGVIKRVSKFMPMVENYAKEKAAKEAQELANGYYKQKNYKDAARLYKAAAEAGDVYSQYSLGFMYRRGQGVPEDFDKAAEWLVKAAENGSEAAEKELDSIMPEIYARQEAMEAGDIASEFVQKNEYDKALPYLKKAADGGDSWAQKVLGVMYKNGNAVPQNYKTAFYWFEQAAKGGDTGAMIILSGFYRDGMGVAKDNKAELYWLKKAAEQGHAEAQYLFGLITDDRYDGRMWWQKAADQGHEKAREALNKYSY
jgi:TPR repeat protein